MESKYEINKDIYNLLISDCILFGSHCESIFDHLNYIKGHIIEHYENFTGKYDSPEYKIVYQLLCDLHKKIWDDFYKGESDIPKYTF